MKNVISMVNFEYQKSVNKSSEIAIDKSPQVKNSVQSQRIKTEVLKKVMVNASKLNVGMILDEDVYTKRGKLLANEGQTVSYQLINNLKNYLKENGVREPIRVLSDL